MAEGEQGDGAGRESEAGWSGEPSGRVSTRAENEAAIAFGRKFGLGCFTFVIGGFSGGMVAVLIGQFIDGLRKAPGCDGLPVCNWYVYVGVGGLLGAVSLPLLVLRRLTRKR
ncbi:MAG: hypothetical protein ABI910_24155 [Gemmatimonadota bacterium]